MKTSHFEFFHTYFCGCKWSIKLAQEHTKIELAAIQHTEQENKVQHKLSGSCYICDRYGKPDQVASGFPKQHLKVRVFGAKTYPS